MTHHSTQYSAHSSPLLEFETLPMQAITLEPHHFEQAVEISDRAISEPQQWQTYLNALALFGFQEWLSELAPDLVLDWKDCSILKPEYANAIEAVCHLNVNNFQLCLIATGGSIDSTIKIPRPIVDLPEFSAHFYVIVNVLEEQGYVQVSSFLRYDRWQSHQQTQPLSIEQDWFYSVPIDWFDQEPNRLLLHLRCLDSEAIALPQSRPIANQANLQEILFQQTSQTETVLPLRKLLTWEQSTAILTNPALLDWFYHLQRGEISSATPPSTAATASFLQPVIDAGRWLQNELDEVSLALGWILLPPFPALRSLSEETTQLRQRTQATFEEINDIRKKLARNGVVIPSEARCIQKDLEIDALPLRLYIATWQLPAVDSSDASSDEWALLFILKKQFGDRTPRTIQLCIKDQTKLLDNGALQPDAEENYLYTCVIGELNETFFVTIALDNGVTLTLPPFTFSSGKA